MTIPSSISPALKVSLRFLGMWPGDTFSAIYWLSFMLSMLIIQYFQLQFDSIQINQSVDTTSVRIFHQILAAMDNDWRRSFSFEKHLYTMTVKASISHFISNALLSINAIVAVPYLLGDYAIRYVLTENHTDTLRQLPIKIQFPFDAQQSPIFEILVVTLFLHVLIHACTIAVLNGLILTLVLHVSGQIDIICCEFRNLSKDTVLHKSSVPLFGMLLERHNRIISFSKNLETLFSFISLMQVVWNTLVICCLGFVIIISIDNGTGIFVLVKTVSGYFVVMVEAFVICFAGEYLSLKSKSVGDAIYETLWYDMPTHQSKIIIFIIMRSQKRLAITAGKMVDMSFETFTSIMKASASYVSVLYAMY
ncbi:odorant receptor 22c isoform X2 [Solenopsis invicta]|uniref:odorant receptor 22c isoform X2 n=1 Tax=Solenopsis invicta TaxID=13686 RepID=UPI00193D16FD|nr:odorant receptor 22c isoform X2 [Solenopsis invicta]